MKGRNLITSFAVLLIMAASVYGQKGDNNVVTSILKSYSSKVFSTEPVSDDEIDQIVKCGIKAPSARNMQPWRFTVVKDTSLTKKILPGINEGNILIIVSGPDDEQRRDIVYYDCALASENMYIAAQSLGLGAHIYFSPIRNIDSTVRESLEIPVGYMPISILRFGNIDSSVDAVSSASSREPIGAIVNYK